MKTKVLTVAYKALLKGTSFSSHPSPPAHSSLGLWACWPLGLEHSFGHGFHPTLSAAFPNSPILNLISPSRCSVFPYNIYYHLTSNILLIGFFDRFLLPEYKFCTLLVSNLE